MPKAVDDTTSRLLAKSSSRSSDEHLARRNEATLSFSPARLSIYRSDIRTAGASRFLSGECASMLGGLSASS
jgi:hypothetical protein